MVKPVSRSFEFGTIRIDLANRRLSREGQFVRLTPKGFELLVLLVENRGRVVDREMIMGALWPETSVEESNLTQTIYLLRRALGQGPDGKSYIETIPKIGYRLVAPVLEAASILEAPSILDAGLVASDASINRKDEDAARSDSPSVTAKRAATEDRAGTGANAVATPAAAGAASHGAHRKFTMALTAALGLVCLVLVFVYLSRSRAPGKVMDVRSIAVLPFKPIHIEAKDEYLGLGMADALSTRLSALRSVTVRPTEAIRRFAGVDRDSLEVGRELGVEAVLTGSVQRLGNRLRITVQLVHVKDGAPLWSGQFDEKFTDVFALEDSISRHITGTLTVKLSGEESRLLVRHGTEDPEAFDLYLKGRYYWGQETPASLKRVLSASSKRSTWTPPTPLLMQGWPIPIPLLHPGCDPPKDFRKPVMRRPVR